MLNLVVPNNQLSKQKSSLGDFSTNVGRFEGKKIVHIPNDAIKSGSNADIKGFGALFLIPLALILGIIGVVEFCFSGGKSHAIFDLIDKTRRSAC